MKNEIFYKNILIAKDDEKEISLLPSLYYIWDNISIPNINLIMQYDKAICFRFLKWFIIFGFDIRTNEY